MVGNFFVICAGGGAAADILLDVFAIVTFVENVGDHESSLVVVVTAATITGRVAGCLMLRRGPVIFVVVSSHGLDIPEDVRLHAGGGVDELGRVSLQQPHPQMGDKCLS